ncbi:NUDIX domain-containing protein [Erysipelatoclostridium sp. An15]|uniref:NUDIX hydrolase n=1 Tax=Erysipelatoclostridium sp. An15 TaxID=1965566 RepID=UPI000B3AE5EA|nr:NUDIX domain-containing protein [Erysipelatoclostridium sp. An15]OUQ07916.1 NUDIX domain-containing protein [Erysipelatoclostridium sp. An15]
MKNVRFHITVKGIVVLDNKILLLKRVKPSTDGLGFWELPGGGLEYGETPNQALIRELKEETGLDIVIIKPAYTFTKIREDYQTVGIGFLCIPKNDHVRLSDEHTDYCFVTIEKAKELLDKEIYNDIIYTIEEYYLGRDFSKANV